MPRVAARPSRLGADARRDLGQQASPVRDLQTHHTEFAAFSPPDAATGCCRWRKRWTTSRATCPPVAASERSPTPPNLPACSSCGLGEPIRREGTLKEGVASSARSRPLGFDIVVTTCETVPCVLTRARHWATSLYRGMFGKHLLAAMDYFPDESRYTLKLLRVSNGECLLACNDVPELKFVPTVTAARRRRSRSARPERVRRAL